MQTFEQLQKNFGLRDFPVKKLALDTQRIAAVTYCTGQTVHIIENNKNKQERRTKLQAAVADLVKWRASEDDLDVVLKNAIEKNMRV